MELTRCFAYVFILLAVFNGVFSTVVDHDADENLSAIFERILEKRDAAIADKFAAMESEISGLKLKMNEMELQFSREKKEMRDEIDGLKHTLVQLKVHVHQSDDVSDDMDQHTAPLANRIRRHSSTRRAAPEEGIAFYATHTDHDVHHLGINQVLLFQQVVTNVGNAYNNSSGLFTAPVDGTYVFHGTVMGIDIQTGTHIKAHFDVDGTGYSRFWVTAWDQSSQMLVIVLKAGQTVSVRNDILDTGFVGTHFSTFSGFLLYEHSPFQNVIG